MYSFPTVLLMWAMVSFLVASGVVCFTASSLSDRMLVGGAWILIGVSSYSGAALHFGKSSMCMFLTCPTSQCRSSIGTDCLQIS
ncbi:uncharacterized protein BT62DRAFT_938932 [Guyanagaster necrorhizus]|uniref:Uncharacterized protein n=1 Tax=Guyanagaster necrorhizus TaxID=856835 RepID=A0A9P8AM48_9AGAR|nr:uncharacterized protein BT62DRAFT_938932 [Guyanagaster necrorhizus MCA 3950]KAG7439492.1 hypothetical protein BT62DRAFT_938932 [Guyanagaster necrorhizus MCA 3950]